LKHAIPFHSVETEEEAESLIVTCCPLGLIGNRREYVVRRTWSTDDYLSAIRAAAEQFGIEPLR
jgi:hypothetical protein